MYVIKTKEGAFVEEHTNGKELNYVFTDIQMAQHYTQSHLKILYNRFIGTWKEKGFEVYKIKYELERSTNWL